jgi:hypothetical protein
MIGGGIRAIGAAEYRLKFLQRLCCGAADPDRYQITPQIGTLHANPVLHGCNASPTAKI